MSDDLRPNNGDGGPRGDAPAWQPIELLLKQGTAEELEAMRAEVARDPIKALELAEEVELLESLRQVRTEPGPHMAAKMQGVLQQADRFCEHHYRATRPGWQRPLLFAAAAAATFFALVGLDPLGQPERAARTFDEVAELSDGAAQRIRSEADGAARLQPVLIEPAEQRWQETVQRIQARVAIEDSEHLRSALARGVAEQGDELGEWLDPANAVTMMRLGHELRASAEAKCVVAEHEGRNAAKGGACTSGRRLRSLGDTHRRARGRGRRFEWVRRVARARVLRKVGGSGRRRCERLVGRRW